MKPVSDDVLAKNKAYCRGLDVPQIKAGSVGAASHFVAFVGGAPTVANHVDELKNFDGEIFAINDTYFWCKEQGIDATLYTIDCFYNPDGEIERAVLGDTVCPELADKCKDLEIVQLNDGIDCRTTSAGTAPMWAIWRGHKHVTFFGCDSGFEDGKHHVYDAPGSNMIWVDIDGTEYQTSPQMIMQAEEMAAIAREFPGYVTVKGDGLLPTLIDHGEYEVTHVCSNILNAVKEQA